MFQDEGNPQEEVGVEIFLPEDLVGIFAGTGNQGGKVPYWDSLPVQPVPDYRTYMHNRKSVEPSRFHRMGFW